MDIHVSAEAAVSLLEHLPPGALLPDHLARIRAVLATEQEREKQRPRAKHVHLVSKKAPAEPLGPLQQVRSAVLAKRDLLSQILYMDGSLAICERQYDMMVGYENPKPFTPKELFKRGTGGYVDPPIDYIRHRGTPSHALVCKKWKALVIGLEGRTSWKTILEEEDREKVRLAKTNSNNAKMTWSERICAMAICNDVHALKKAFQNPSDISQGIGAALEEQGSHDSDDDSHYSHEVESDEQRRSEFATSIAYAAAKVGSIKSLKYLEPIAGDDLWRAPFDEKGSHFLGNLVKYACHLPVLEGPVVSIQYLLSGGVSSAFGEDLLHLRHFGSNGNHLHLAAARGHKSLVQALLDAGMDRYRSCTKISSLRGRSHDPRDRGVKDLPLPIDWAKVRGHTEVVELLRSFESIHRPDLRLPNLQYKTGKLSTFFPISSRQYGFIEPGGIFVHLNQMRQCTIDQNAEGYPMPGQLLCFTVTTDRQGRKRADTLLDGKDFSFLRLPLDEYGAEQAWERYKYYDTDDEEEEEEEESYGQQYCDYANDDDLQDRSHGDSEGDSEYEDWDRGHGYGEDNYY